MNKQLKDADKILNKMYKKFRKNVTEENWQAILNEVKQKQIELDGRVLEGAELEELAKANIMSRLVVYANSKGSENND